MSEKKKLLVGIPGFLNEDKMFGVTGNYMQFAARYGDVRILMPQEEHVAVDLLILPGGLDLSPSKYGKIPGYKTGNHDVFKEFFFEQRLQNYIDSGTPIFGICLGFQMLNVKFGGTLVQHLIAHPQSPGRWQTAHEVVTVYDEEGRGKPDNKGRVLNPYLKVNSHHHQAVTRDTISDQFKEIAVSRYQEPEGVIVEAFLHKELKISGVQYHPEELVFDELSGRLIEEILK